MFATGATPVERPAEWRSNSYHYTSKSALTSPAGSRRSSISSITSAQTEPGLVSDNSRNSSSASATSMSSSKSGFRSLFGKKDKKPKEKKDVEKIILTSRHAAAAKTAMMMNAHLKKGNQTKTANVVGTVHTGHLTAAQQEARHPHSGPPALHAKVDMPLLTRIISGDERDEEDELDRLEKARLDWDLAKAPGFCRIHEHEGTESMPVSAEPSDDEAETPSSPKRHTMNFGTQRALSETESPRPLVSTRNSYGGRFHKDERGHWRK